MPKLLRAEELQDDGDVRNGHVAALHNGHGQSRVADGEEEPSWLAVRRLLAMARSQASRLQEAARARARETVATARREAQELRARAREEGYAEGRQTGFAEGRREGWDAGYAEGRQAGEEAVRREMADAMLALRRCVDEAIAQRQQALAQAQSDVLKLAVAIAEIMVRKHLEADPDLPVRLLAEALGRVGRQTVTVKAHADVVARLEACRPLWMTQAKALRVELVADPSLGPHDLRVEAEWGELDGRLESRWVRVLEALARGGDAGAGVTAWLGERNGPA